MTQNRKKIAAALLTLFISLPTIIEGSSVLLGISKPDQIILTWLVLYNVTAAALSLGIIFFFFKRPKTAVPFSLLIMVSHITVLGILLIIFFTGGDVAVKSIAAMSLRSLVWFIIFTLSGKIADEK